MVTFIRIPKNASTSIYTWLGERNTIRDECLSADNPVHKGIFCPSHCTLDQAERVLGPHILEAPILAVVRNPYDRLVSMYSFAKKLGLGAIYGISTETFTEFARGFYINSMDPSFFHGWSQAKYIGHGDKANVFVARFETIYDDIARFVQTNNLEMNAADLGRLNSTERADYSEYYGPETRAIVDAMWGSDIEQYGYQFDK